MTPDVVYICNIMVTIFQYPGCDVYKVEHKRKGSVALRLRNREVADFFVLR